MKLISLNFFLIIFLSGVHLNAQYIPLPVDSASWLQSYFEQSGPGEHYKIFSEYSILGDTTLDNITYSKVFFQRKYRYDYDHGEESFYELDSPKYFIGGLREDSARVFFHFIEPEVIQLEYPLDITPSDDIYQLYDFNLQPGESTYWPPNDYEVIEFDTLELNNGEKRRTHEFWQSSTPYYWIEGIGSNMGLITFTVDQGPPWFSFPKLHCFSLADEIVFSQNTSYLVDCKKNPAWDNPTAVQDAEISTSKSILIAPNPVVSETSISMPGHTSFFLRITDITGKEVLKQTVNNAIQIPRGIFSASGIYIAEVRINDQVFYNKILVL